MAEHNGRRPPMLLGNNPLAWFLETSTISSTLLLPNILFRKPQQPYLHTFLSSSFHDYELSSLSTDLGED
jgi:hypothetical protein